MPGLTTGRPTAATAMALAAALVAPLVVLEVLNQPGSGTDFPVALFIGLWALPALGFHLAIPALRGIRAEGLAAHPLSLLWRATWIALVTVAWVSLVRDQMSCFLGVPNCD